MNEKQRLRGNLQNRTNSWLECEQVIGHLRKQIARLEQERDELHRKYEQQVEKWYELVKLIDQKDEAIRKIKDHMENDFDYDVSVADLDEILTMATDDGPKKCPHCLDGKNVYHGNYSAIDPDCEHCNGTGYQDDTATAAMIRENADRGMERLKQLEKERDELRQTIKHLENGWKIDSNTLEECQIENARLRVLIHDNNEAIRYILLNVEEMDHMEIDVKLHRIAAMTTDDSPDHCDETDRRCNDAVIRCNDCGMAPRSFEWWCPKCGTWKEYGNLSEEENNGRDKTAESGEIRSERHDNAVRRGDSESGCNDVSKGQKEEGDRGADESDISQEVADDPSHKCQNNIDAATGECAVCGEDAEVADDEWMNAPMGSPDAPTCHNSDCQYYDTNEAGNCGASEEFGVLVPISECHDAILSPPDAPTHLDEHDSFKTTKEHVNDNADAIEKMQRELEVGRANDRFFNEKLDYIGEMKEEIQQQIDSHTSITHGEIERRLAEMGQKINQLNSDDKMAESGEKGDSE